MSADNPELPAFIADVQKRLAEPLPGRAAQETMEPQGAGGRHFQVTADARLAAVMILCYPHADRWWLPLTVRPATLEHHPGQVSFPGGKLETGEDPWTAATRELQEELGVGPEQLHRLGELSPIMIVGSNFYVHPQVAWTTRRPAWRPDPREVSAVLEIPLLHLVEPRNYGQHDVESHGRIYHAPHIAFEGYRIWGATSMMLAEWAAILESIG